MAIPQTVRRYTPEEYYQHERAAAQRSEYFAGEIFLMAGGSTNHSIIVVNLVGELRQRLKGRPCAPYESNQRLKVTATGLRAYPDVSVYCEPLEYDPEDSQSDTAINLTVLFEVLSDSTEGYDRGFKAENYRKIESLKAYIIVSQRSAHVEMFERRGDGSWTFVELSGLDAVLDVPGTGVTLPLAEVYDRVDFPKTPFMFRVHDE